MLGNRFSHTNCKHNRKTLMKVTPIFQSRLFQFLKAVQTQLENQSKLEKETYTLSLSTSYPELVIKERQHLRLLLLVGFGEWWFLSNQITLFLDHLGKINLYIRFLDEVNHQANLATGTTSFGWLWLLVSLIQTDCRIP